MVEVNLIMDHLQENQLLWMNKFKVSWMKSQRHPDMTKPWTSSIPMTQVQDRGIVKLNF